MTNHSQWTREFQIAYWLILISATIFLTPYCAKADLEGKVTSVDPVVIQQGDTVLLTITGENLPTGTVVVEFFPQQIALLDVLSATKTEVIAQVKVPSLAQPGKYNILVYNHLGEELFAEGLLEVSSQVITPVFRDYQPKTIGDATDGFALLLTGESITPDMISHLAMQWSVDGKSLDRLTTIFSYGTRGQVLCAITGLIPGGKLLGKITLDEKPIYLVEVNNQTTQAMIVGQRPTALQSSQEPYLVTFVGMDISASFIGALDIRLESNQLAAKASNVSLIDDTSFEAEFTGPLPVGGYQLMILQGEDSLFKGSLELTEGSEMPESSESVEVELEELVPASDPEDSTESLDSVVLNNDVKHISAKITSLAPVTVVPGSDPASFAFTSTGLTAEQYDRLDVELEVGGQTCDLLFIGAGSNSCTCMFAAPGGEWQAGQLGLFSTSDPQGEVEDFRIEIAVTGDNASRSKGAMLPTPSESDVVSVARSSVEQTDILTLSILDIEELKFKTDSEAVEIYPDSLVVEIVASSETGFKPENISIVFSPEPQRPNSAYFKQEMGKGLMFLLDLTAWDPLQLETGLRVKLDSTSIVHWVNGPILQIPNTAGSMSPVSSKLNLMEESKVDNAGFTFYVSSAGPPPDSVELNAVSLLCSDNLLSLNMGKFSPSVSADSTDEGYMLIVRFERVKEELDEVAYGLLMDQLIDGPAVEVSLEWQKLGQSVSTDVSFIRDN